MKVEYVDPDAGFGAILGESAFGDLIDLVVRDGAVLLLIAEVIKTYHSRQSLAGGQWPPDPIETFTNAFAARLHTKGAAAKVAASIRSLYAAHDPHHVRGAILEGLVEQKLKTRYGGPGQDLKNNHKIRCSEDEHDPYQSSTTIDVVGWDQTVGECHDCKVAAKEFKSSFIAELETHLVPRRFKIGMVTADTHAATRVAFDRKGFRPKHAQIIPLEGLWKLAPLQT